jgi:hypothetical protein
MTDCNHDEDTPDHLFKCTGLRDLRWKLAGGLILGSAEASEAIFHILEVLGEVCSRVD